MEDKLSTNKKSEKLVTKPGSLDGKCNSNTISFSNQQYKALYIKDLPVDIGEKSLFKIFSKISQVVSVKIFSKESEESPSNYCCINFKTFDDAKRAFDILNFYSDGKIFFDPIRFTWNNPDSPFRKSGDGNLFVKNLPKNFESNALYELFSPFGKISSCKIASDEEGNSLCHGFVLFEDPFNGKRAISELNGIIIEKKKIFVGPFIKKEDRGEVAKPKFTNIYVKNLELDKCNKESIMDIFGVFGEITSIFIPKDGDKPLGFVFVNFFFPEEAEEAIFSMNNKRIGNIPLYVGKAETKLERQRNLKKNFSKKKSYIEKLKKRFLVRGLPENLEKSYFTRILSKIGTVSVLKFFKKSKESVYKFALISFRKSKALPKDTKQAAFFINTSLFFLESWKMVLLKVGKLKKLFLKKKVEKEVEAEFLDEKNVNLDIKSEIRISNRKKIFSAVLKNFSSFKRKQILVLLLFLYLEKRIQMKKKK